MKLVLIRHGESQWNLENKFTGWKDVDLSPKGVEEAKAGGKALKEMGLVFDIAYTSYLKRAIKTLNYVLEELDELYIPVYKSWRLNERHYGALQGLNKAETAKKYGDEQVLIWRRSFDVAPPAIDKSSEYYPKSDRRYADLSDSEAPLGESLKDTIERVLPYWHSHISKSLQEGKNAIVAAHGNSLRALIKYLLNISDDDILKLNLTTGKPLIFEIDKDLENTLRKKFSSKENYILVMGDVLKVDFRKYINQGTKVVANIPYYITSPIINKIIENKDLIDEAYIMVQKEVGERICAKSGKERGILTLAVEYYGEAEYLFTIPREFFNPIPNVDSAFISIKFYKDDRYKNKISEDLFFKYVKAAFSNKRKNIVNNLAILGYSKDKIKEMLNQIEISENERAENISTDKFIELINIFEGR